MDRPKRTARKRLRFDTEPEPEPVSPSPKVRRREINARYRAKIHSDPAKAAAYKAREAQRMRAYRAALTSEKKEEQNRKRRERYKKKRDEGLVPKNPKVPRPKTRASQQAQDDLRERNRLAQRKRRQNMSSQKKRRERERSLAYYHAHKKLPDPARSGPPQLPSGSIETTTARSSAVYRLRQKLGKGGKKLLLNLQRLLRATNKSNSSDLQAHGITYSSPTKTRLSTPAKAFHSVVEHLKPLRSKTSLEAKKLVVQAAQNVMDKYSLRKFNLHRSRMSHPYERKEMDRTSQIISSFYEDNSVFLAGKKTVTSDLQSKKILDKSIVKLFNNFVKENGTLVARATFYRKRPKHVLSFLKTPYRQCMCDICLNPMIKVNVLNRLYGSQVGCVADLVRMTVCERLKKVCLMRQCGECGLDGLGELLNVARLRCEGELEWKRWEKVERKGMSRLELVAKRGSFDTFASELRIETEKLPLHDFVHRWQTKQYQSLCKCVPEGWAILTLDFAENYLCRQQDQPQSAYFGYSQVTIHPCVLYFNCVCGERVTSNVVFYSDDLNHSANMVHVILQKLLCFHLPANIHHVVIFSDGCSSQYKSKLPFFFMWNLQSNSNVSIERCYFGARHGKNPCDALGVVVKQAASRAVLSRQVVIQNATDMLTFSNENLRLDSVNSNSCSCTHVKRCFDIVHEDDLSDMASSSLKTLKGTRAIHSIRLARNGLLVRNLSCFCSACKSGLDANCPNVEFAGSWKMMNCADSWSHFTVDNVSSNSILNTAFVQNKEDQSSAPSESQHGNHDLSNSPDTPTDPHLSLSNVIVDAQTDVPSAFSSTPLVDVEVVSSCTFPAPLITDSRESFFLHLSQEMNNCKSYDDLVVCVKAFSEELTQFELPSSLAYPSIYDCKGSVDQIALKLVPSGLNDLYPLIVQADGNCVPRTLSVWLFGSEDFHLEVRCRIVIEHVTNSSFYLSLPSPELETLSLLSDFHNEDVTQTYQAEVFDVRLSSAYMGMWQLMAACNAFGVQILSVYPKLGPEIFSSFFNRTLRPTHIKLKHCIALLWSSCRDNDMEDEYWVANHVVPLLHLTKACAIIC